MNHWPRNKAGHILKPGKCRYGGTTGRNSGPRSGHHPRSPMPPAVEEPTAGLPAAVRNEDGAR
eukprot:10120781-Alexandrium_andersonii.AAC.1